MIKRTKKVITPIVKAIILLSIILSVILPGSVIAMEDNSSSVPGNPVYTDDAFYYSDQYMWKVSLFVAKSDTVYLKEGEDAKMSDFYRIGDDAVYISPINVNDWNGWLAGKRPSSPITETYYSKDNKVDTLLQLQSNGNNVELLPNVELTTKHNINVFQDPNVPKVPQLNDGDVYDNGVIVKDPNMVGDITTVKQYFTNPKVAYGVLNYFAAKNGQTPGDYLKTFTFTINGETRADWNPAGILPNAIKDVNNTGTLQENTTSQVQWLVVYEPVSIVYVKDIGALPAEAYYGYALSATDFAVMQVKHQMDWRYDETRWTAWTGLQPDAWKPNGDRQHVSRLAFLLMGNSVITEKDWYGLAKSQNWPDPNAAVPNNRWYSDNQIKYGGWGMARLKAPVAAKTKPMNQDYRPDTDIIYSCQIFSNKQAGDGGEDDKITVTYNINGENFVDKVTVPVGSEATSYFKWRTPNVTEVTGYELTITVSPYPEATIGNIEPHYTTTEPKDIYGGNEYVKKVLTVRPISEITPPDPKVHDKLPSDFNDGLVPPVPNVDETVPKETGVAEVINYLFVTPAPFYKNDTVKVDIVTNKDTEFITLYNKDKDTTEQVTTQSSGQGLLDSLKKQSDSDNQVWTLTIKPEEFGMNHYTVTPSNSLKGPGEAKLLDIEVSVDEDNPTIIDVVISPLKALYTLFEEVIATPLFYDVYFETYGGSVVDTQNIEYNTLVTTPVTPTKEGYAFSGWFKDPAYGYVWDFNTEKVMGVSTVYAKWTINTYTVSFDAMGGSAVASIPADYGTAIIEPASPTRSGYTFKGWYEDIACTQLWNFGVNTVKGNTTLYAKWDPVSYTVKFDALGGSLVQDIIADYNSTILAPNPPEKEGHAFAGWYKDAACTSVWTWATDRVQGGMTLYAKWVPNLYVVTFDSQEGSAVPTKEIQFDTLMTAPVEPTRPGYVFDGWYREDSYLIKWDFATNKVSKDTTLYAKWIAQASSIEFESNGGNAIAKMIGTTGQVIPDINMPLVAKDGFTFNGWYLEEDFSGDVITSLPAAYPVGSLKYFASWTINQYTVSFEENGGNDLTNLALDYDSLIPEPTITRNGYSFDGWFLDAEYDEPWDFATDKIKGATTLYAKWQVNAYTVTFEENGGSLVDDLTGDYGTPIVAPTTTRYGYALEGWYRDVALTQPWDFANDLIEGNTTLYAKWTENAYRLDDIFPDENLAEAVRLEMNKRPERLADPIPDTAAKVVTQTDLDYVTELSATGLNIAIVDGIGQLKNLTKLDLSNNVINSIPVEIGSLDQLGELNLKDNNITGLPDAFYQLSQLTEIDLSDNALTGLSEMIDNFDLLNNFDVRNNQLTGLPDGLWNLTDMEYLYLGGNAIGNLSEEIGNLTKLIELDVSGTNCDRLPLSIGSLTHLTVLNAGGNTISELPTSFKNLSTLKSLNIGSNKLTTISDSILGGLDQLQVLDWSSNQVTTLTKSIKLLNSLQQLNLNSNLLTELPDEVTTLTNLTQLNLRNNTGLINLPLSMGNLTQLTELFISGTGITQLPLSLEGKPITSDPTGLPYGYSVTFETSGGSVVSPIRADYQTKVAVPTEIPTRTNYEFLGWCKDETCLQAWDFNNDTIQGNTIIYANWKRTVFTVVFEVNGGSAVDSQTIDAEGLAIRPINPTKDGFYFKDWFKDAAFTQVYDFNTPITEDVKLYCRWLGPGDDLDDYTWPDIVDIADKGEGDDYFDVGDEITITLTTGEEVVLQIYGFDHDTKTDGSKTNITFGTKNLLADDREMKGTAVNYGGWDQAALRSWMNGALYSQIPTEVQAGIKSVKKVASTGAALGTLTTSSDQVFAFSEREVTGNETKSLAGEGRKYPIFDTYTKIKNMNGGSANAYWLRSSTVASSTDFTDINADGSVGSQPASNQLGVAFGFAIGMSHQYTVTFDTQGGNEGVIPQTVNANDLALDPNMTLTKNGGFFFDAWYKDAACTQKFDFYSEYIKSNTTLYAGWKEMPAKGSPLEDFTWEQIGIIADAGQGDDYWDVAAEKDLTLSTGETLTMQIYGFNHDPKSDGSGDTNITFGCKDLMKDYRLMNSTSTNLGGWTSSSVRSWTNSGLYGSLGNDVKSIIKTVNKQTTSGSNSSTITESPDKVFLFSESEIYNNVAAVASEGKKYEIFNSQINIAKKLNGINNNWWLRSPAKDNQSFVSVFYNLGTAYVSLQGIYANTINNGVNFGFAVGSSPYADVTYNTNGGSSITSQKILKGTTVATPTAPTRANYTFGGWYKDAAFSQSWNFATDTITGQTTLYAKWVATVTFNSNGGSSVAAITADLNSTITKPEAPSLTNYTFAGWYKDAGLTVAFNFATGTVTQNTTLYAKWDLGIPDASVPLDNWSWEQIAKVADLGLAQNYFVVGEEKNITLSTGEVLTLQIYDFNHDVLGDGTGNKTNITFGLKNLMNNMAPMFMNLDYYQGWRDSYMRGYVNGTVYSIIPTNVKNLIKPVFKYSGQHEYEPGVVQTSDKLFLFSDEEVTGANGVASGPLSRVGEGYKYPIFNDTAKLLKQRNGTNDLWWLRSPSVSSAPNNTYYFNVWNSVYYNPGNYSSGVNFGFAIGNAPTNTYQTTFNSNGGSAISPTISTVNTTISKPTDPTKANAVFNGWYKDAGLTQSWNFASDKVTGAMTLYAKWIDLPAVGTPLESCTWQQIDLISKAGLAQTYFHLGDTKNITLSTGEVVPMQIYGFNHDTKTDGSGSAGITFGTKYALLAQIKWGAYSSSTTYMDSNLKTYIEDIYTTKLPSDTKAVIKNVFKSTKTSAYYADFGITTFACNIFAFSYDELTNPADHSYTDYNEGNLYAGMYAGVPIEKGLGNSSPAYIYWTRTPIDQYCGAINNGASLPVRNWEKGYNGGVVFGFCV